MPDPVPDPADAPDWQLLRDYAQSGSQDAFTRLVNRHVQLVYSSALRQMRNRHDAEDITQAVFIMLARDAGEMTDRVIVPAWLYRATRYACLNALKAKSRREKHEMASQRQQPVAVSGGGADPAWDDSLPLLDDALASLGEKDRTLLVLRYLKGLSVQEAAGTLGMSGNTASQRMGRAVEKLRHFFARKGIAMTAVAITAALAAQQQASGAYAAPAGLASAAVKTAAVGIGTTTSATAARVIADAALLAMKTSMSVKQTAGLVALLVLLLGVGVAGVVGLMGSGERDVTLSSMGPKNAPPVAAQRVMPPAPIAVAEYMPGGTVAVLADPRRAGDRELGQTIEAEFYDAGTGVSVVAPGLTSWTETSFSRYDNVDFGSAASLSGGGPATHFFAEIACPEDAGASLEVRIDSPSEAPICVLPVARNGGVVGRTAQSAPLNRIVLGRHSVFLKITGQAGIAAINVDWIKFLHLPRGADHRIEAEHFDAMKGIRVTDAGVAHLDRGDFLRYSDVRFTAATAYVFVRCGVRGMYAGHHIQFRIDRVNGPIIAELKVKDTGEFTQFQTQSTKVRPVSGTHDLYMTFDGNGVANVRWFQFGSTATPPAYNDPDIRQPPATQPVPSVGARLLEAMGLHPTSRPTVPATRPAAEH